MNPARLGWILALVLATTGNAGAEVTSLRTGIIAGGSTPRAVGGRGCGVRLDADSPVSTSVGGPNVSATLGTTLCSTGCDATWLFIPARPSAVFIHSAGGASLRYTVFQDCQGALANVAAGTPAAGLGTVAGHLLVNGGATINNGLSLGGATGVLTPSPTNIATGKVIAESTDPFGYPAANANDGNPATFSHTGNATGEWIAIDLGTAHVVREMVLRKNGAFFGHRPADFLVQTADDWAFTANVTTVATVTGANEETTTVAFPAPVSSRFWRILSTAAEYVELVEWEVYESLAGPLVTVNGSVSVAGNVTASGIHHVPSATAAGATACDSPDDVGASYVLANATRSCLCVCAQAGAGYGWAAVTLAGACGGADC